MAALELAEEGVGELGGRCDLDERLAEGVSSGTDDGAENEVGVVRRFAQKG